MNSAATVLIIAAMTTAIVAAARIINKRGAGHLPASVSNEKVKTETRKHPFDEEVKAQFRSLTAPNDCPQDSKSA
ncbi:hypothetical protein B0T11DRAFT_326636 [Plectosphaerella cucumerina]|uniref:Secreted protein n=1 Tax=Plectosphaerella cucumerina TaxID=40658 RepID=A0A8K0TNI2_9PEZI|nr:hypothetical protein B0T11DRAFT_326636 [Plectosphaerella cucumerina]